MRYQSRPSPYEVQRQSHPLPQPTAMPTLSSNYPMDRSESVYSGDTAVDDAKEMNVQVNRARSSATRPMSAMSEASTVHFAWPWGPHMEAQDPRLRDRDPTSRLQEPAQVYIGPLARSQSRMSRHESAVSLRTNSSSVVPQRTILCIPIGVVRWAIGILILLVLVGALCIGLYFKHWRVIEQNHGTGLA